MNIRQIILERIEDIRILENGFDRSNIKWKGPLSHGMINSYADEFDFDVLSDAELVFIFERILYRYHLSS